MRPAILIALALLLGGCDWLSPAAPGIMQCICGPDRHVTECSNLVGSRVCHTHDGGGIVAGEGCVCIGRYYGPVEADDYRARDGKPKAAPVQSVPQ